MKNQKQELLKLPKLKEIPGWRIDTMSPKLQLHPMVLTPYKVSSKKLLNISPRYPKNPKLPRLLTPISIQQNEKLDEYLLESKLFHLDLPEHTHKDPNFLYSRKSYSSNSYSSIDFNNLQIPSMESNKPSSSSQGQKTVNKTQSNKNLHIASKNINEAESLVKNYKTQDVKITENFSSFDESTKKFKENVHKYVIFPPEKELEEEDEYENIEEDHKYALIHAKNDLGKHYQPGDEYKVINQKNSFKKPEILGLVENKTDSEERNDFYSSAVSYNYPKAETEDFDNTFRILDYENDEQIMLGKFHYNLLKPFVKLKDTSRISENLVLDHKAYEMNKSFQDSNFKDENSFPGRLRSESEISFTESDFDVSSVYQNGLRKSSSGEFYGRKWKSAQYRIIHSSESQEDDLIEKELVSKCSIKYLNHPEGHHNKNSDVGDDLNENPQKEESFFIENGAINIGKLKVLEVSTEKFAKTEERLYDDDQNIDFKTERSEKLVKLHVKKAQDDENNIKSGGIRKEAKEESKKVNNEEKGEDTDLQPTEKLMSSKTVKKGLKRKIAAKAGKKNTNPARSPNKLPTKPSPPLVKLGKAPKKNEKNTIKSPKPRKTGKISPKNLEKVQIYSINGKEMQISIVKEPNSQHSSDSLKDPSKLLPDSISTPKNTEPPANLENLSVINSLQNPINQTTSPRISLKLPSKPDSILKTQKNSLINSNRNSSIDSLLSVMKKNAVSSFIHNFSSALLKTVKKFRNSSKRVAKSKMPTKKPEQSLTNIKSEKSLAGPPIRESSSLENKEKIANSSTNQFISRNSIIDKSKTNLSHKGSEHSIKSKASVFSKYKSGNKNYVKKLEVSLKSKNSSISMIKKDSSEESSSFSYDESESLEQDSEFSESEEESSDSWGIEKRLRNSALYEVENFDLIKNLAMSIFENKSNKLGRDSELLGKNLSEKLDIVTEIDESRSREQEKIVMDVSKSEFDLIFMKPVQKFIFFRDEKGSMLKNTKKLLGHNKKIDEEPEQDVRIRTEKKEKFLKAGKNQKLGLKDAEYAFLEIIPTEEFITEKLKLGKNSRLRHIDEYLKPKKLK